MTSMTHLAPAVVPADSNFLKTDVLGRIKRTVAQRESILDEYERSGLSGAKYAALCGLKYQTFATWLTRRKRRNSASAKRRPLGQAASQVRWLEAAVPPAQAAAPQGLILHLPGGVQAHLRNEAEASLAAALIRALEKPC